MPPRHRQGRALSKLMGSNRRAPRDHRPIVVFGVVAALCFAFLRLASEMGEGETLRFDRAVLLALRAPHDLADPIGPAWLTDMFVNVTSLGSNAVLGLLSLIVVGYLFVSGRRSGALVVAASAVGAGLLSLTLKDVFHRARPDVIAHIVQAHSASFPSGHSLGSAAIYLTLGLLLTRFDREPKVDTIQSASRCSLRSWSAFPVFISACIGPLTSSPDGRWALRGQWSALR